MQFVALVLALAVAESTPDPRRQIEVPPRLLACAARHGVILPHTMSEADIRLFWRDPDVRRVAQGPCLWETLRWYGQR